MGRSGRYDEEGKLVTFVRILSKFGLIQISTGIVVCLVHSGRQICRYETVSFQLLLAFANVVYKLWIFF